MDLFNEMCIFIVNIVEYHIGHIDVVFALLLQHVFTNQTYAEDFSLLAKYFVKIITGLHDRALTCTNSALL